MAVTVAALNHTEIDDCDAETYWGGNGMDSDTNLKKEGSQSLCFILKSSGNNDLTCTPSSSVDMSGTKHIRIWFLSTVAAQLNTIASGGVQFWVSDGSNTGYYYVAGSDTYEGGWINLVVDLSRTVDAGTKPTAMNTITSCGIRTNMSSGGKQALNTWIDYFHLADGLECYGDDAGGYFDFDNLITAEDTGGWGILKKIGGVFYLTGSIKFGDSSGTNSCKFQSKSQVVIFEDRKVNAGLYIFDIVDNGTGTTEFILGDKSGTAAIQGCMIRVEDSSQTAKFDLDAKTDTDVDNFKMYSTVFYGADAIEFAGDATNVEVIGCSFEKCSQVDTQDCSTSGCFFIDTSDADAALLWNESIDITDCGFFANTTGAGIEMPSAVGTPYDYDGLVFSGNTKDVLNSSGSAISISKSNGSDPSSYEGSTVTFTGAAVTVLVHVGDTDGKDVQNARVFLAAKDGTGPFPFEESVTISNSGTTATVTHGTHGMQNNDFVHIKGASHWENNGAFQITYIDAGSYSYTMPSDPGSSPSGTITSTFVALTGLTDVDGDKSTSRVYPSDQPVIGWARLTPEYKTSTLFGTIDDAKGFSATGVLVDDE